MRDGGGLGERLVKRWPFRGTGCAAAAALILCPAVLQASIPPSLTLLVLSEDPRTEALSRAYVEFLVAGGNFLVAESRMPRRDAAECVGKASDVMTCVARAVVAGGVDKRAPPVVLVSRPAKDGVHWLCVGSDPQKVGKTSKRVSIDLQSALFGTAESRAAQRTLAIGCLFGAAAESEGIIRQ